MQVSRIRLFETRLRYAERARLGVASKQPRSPMVHNQKANPFGTFSYAVRIWPLRALRGSDPAVPWGRWCDVALEA
jgi:hypothetical protein